MSTLSKFLLLLLLALLVHLLFVTFTAAGLVGGPSTYVFPFGSVDYNGLFGFVQIEFYLITIVLIGFGVSLFRSDD